MPPIKRGDIYYIESSFATTGSEQRPGRPAVVVSNNKNNEFSATIEVVYLTTQPKHDLPTHVTIRSTSRESIALCEQITSVAVERFGDFCGRVTDREMTAIEIAMLISLDLYIPDELEQITVSNETPPVPESRLREVEAECRLLQEMYDSLLDKLIKAG